MSKSRSVVHHRHHHDPSLFISAHVWNQNTASISASAHHASPHSFTTIIVHEDASVLLKPSAHIITRLFTHRASSSRAFKVIHISSRPSTVHPSPLHTHIIRPSESSVLICGSNFRDASPKTKDPLAAKPEGLFGDPATNNSEDRLARKSKLRTATLVAPAEKPARRGRAESKNFCWARQPTGLFFAKRGGFLMFETCHFG